MIWVFAMGLVVIAMVTALWPALRRRAEDAGWLEPALPPRDARAMGTATANALAHFETLFNPAMEHVIEIRRAGHLDLDLSGNVDADLDSGRG